MFFLTIQMFQLTIQMFDLTIQNKGSNHTNVRFNHTNVRFNHTNVLTQAKKRENNHTKQTIWLRFVRTSRRFETRPYKNSKITIKPRKKPYG